jgi:hypothetical protein
MNRPLTDTVMQLVRWMLEHGNPDAQAFLSQLEMLEVTPLRCPCGCATLDFQLRGCPPAPPGVHILSDFVFGDEENLNGIFLYESGGVLSGLEVVGYSGQAPQFLPSPEILRPLPSSDIG